MRNRLSSFAVRFGGVLAVVLCGVTQAATYCVTPDAAGGGDGSAWTSPMTLVEALEAAADGDEIWLKEGVWDVSSVASGFTLTNGVKVIGGFVGTSGTSDARNASALTTLDGKDVTSTILTLTLAKGKTATLENLSLTHAYRRGLSKSGAGALEMIHCGIVANGGTFAVSGWNNDQSGRGMYCASSTLTMTNCFVLGNVFPSTLSAGNSSGTGLYLSSVTATITDTLFASNGVPAACNAARGNSLCGSALYAISSTLRVRRSRFLGNRNGCSGGSYAFSGTVYVQTAGGNSQFDHCLFAGNEAIGTGSPSAAFTTGGYRGQRKHYFTNCTFAYNTSAHSAAIHMANDIACVTNCIFYGNVSGSASTAGVDISCGGTSSSTPTGIWVDYSYFAADSMDYLSGPDGALVKGEHNTYGGDVRFVTPLADMTALLDTTAETRYPRLAAPVRFKTAELAKIQDFDLHLLSPTGYVTNAGTWLKCPGVKSPALDKSMPGTDYSREPEPNGGAANLGAYGGTAEASMTPMPGRPVIGADDLKVVFETPYTQPTVNLHLGIANPDDTYEATVTITVGTGETSETAVYAYTNVYTGVANGANLSWRLSEFFTPGATVYVKVYVDPGAGQSVVTATASSAAAGSIPPWSGRGGGANVMHVFQGATGKGDGSSWTDAYTDLHDAILNLTAAKTEIWVTTNYVPNAAKDGITATLSRPIVLRGGFTAIEDAASERPDGTRTVHDGNYERPGLNLSTSSTLTVERFRFTRGKDRGITLAGGTVTMTNCVFDANGYGVISSGLGGAFSGGKLTLVDCVFRDNVVANHGAYSGGLTGQGATFANQTVTLERCDFLRNGLAADTAETYTSPQQFHSIFKASSAPVRAHGCRFIGNITCSGCGGNSYQHAGWIGFANNCSGTVFSNCVFAANEETGSNSGPPGAIYIGTSDYPDSGKSSDTYAFESCTFAYNLSPAAQAGAAAINVRKGAVRIRNSIFYGNMIRAGATAGSEIMLHSTDASADVDYSLLTGSSSAFVSGVNVTLGEHNLYVDPAFVTGTNAFLSLVSSSAEASETMSRATTPFHFDRTRMEDVWNLNLHLLSKAGYVDNTGAWCPGADTTSRAIDAGDPAADYADEPSPNGGRLNLGAYGNTTSASKTPPPGQPAIRDQDFTVTFPNAYTQPFLNVTLSGAHGDDSYSATVIVTVTGDDQVFTRTFANVQNGDALSWRVSGFFEPGETVTADVTVDAGDKAEIVHCEKDVSAQGVKPPWAGRGGGASVVHVFPGATGEGNGTSWTDAYHDLREALQNVTTEIREVWVTTNMELRTEFNAIRPIVPLPVIVRGGFTATENAERDRPAGTRSVYDAETTHPGFAFTHSANLAFERFVFTRAPGTGFSASSGGRVLAMTNCVFSSNGYYRTSGLTGNGAYFASSRLTLSQCVFEDNVITNLGPYNGTLAAQGAYFNGSQVRMDGCVFRRNGSRVEDMALSNVPGQYDAIFQADSSPVVAVGCTFAGNLSKGGGVGSYNHGGIISFANGCGGTVFSNCLFAVNEEKLCNYSVAQAGIYIGASRYPDTGSIDDRYAFENCTFAYNLSPASANGALLNVRKGSVRVRNCIFFGNRTRKAVGAGSDICLLASSAAADVDWSMFSELTTNTISAVAGATLVVGEHNLAGDPCFMTKAKDFRPLILNNAGTDAKSDADCQFDTARFDDVLRFNAHLLGRQGYVDEHTGALVIGRGHESPAIDAGDPSVPCVEPDKRYGNRVNLGFYGNTPYATMSPVRGAFLRVR